MDKEIIPALGYRFLTPLYDSVVRSSTREALFKSKLLEKSNLRPGEAILDVGCGTGTLLKMAQDKQPLATFTGLDADPQMLSVAKKKVAFGVSLVRGYSTALPFENGAFDCTISSLFFHHLDPDSKIASLKEIHRVLKYNGRVVIADWGRASTPLMRALFYQIQLLDGFRNTAGHATGKFIEWMSAAGFSNATELDGISTVFGTISIYQATKLN